MSLLFRTEHIAPILEGAKTQTRRLWPHGPRCKVGALHWAQTGIFGDRRFARLRILRVWQEYVEDITEDDAMAEGYPSRLHFLTAFYLINRRRVPSNVNEKMLVYCIEFEVLA